MWGIYPELPACHSSSGKAKTDSEVKVDRTRDSFSVLFFSFRITHYKLSLDVILAPKCPTIDYHTSRPHDTRVDYRYSFPMR